MQPGPIYFKTPRKCGIFGVMCEAIPRQVNYLIDEALEKEQIRPSAWFIIISPITDLPKHALTFMSTIVQDRTRITFSYGTWLGE